MARLRAGEDRKHANGHLACGKGGQQGLARVQPTPWRYRHEPLEASGLERRAGRAK